VFKSQEYIDYPFFQDSQQGKRILYGKVKEIIFIIEFVSGPT